MQEINNNKLIFTVAPFKYFIKYDHDSNRIIVDAVHTDELLVWTTCVTETAPSFVEQSNNNYFDTLAQDNCNNLNINVCDSLNINTTVSYHLQLSPNIIFDLFRAYKENTLSKKTTITFPTNFVNQDTDICIKFSAKFSPFGKNCKTVHENSKTLVLQSYTMNFEGRFDRKLMFIKLLFEEKFEILYKLISDNDIKYSDELEKFGNNLRDHINPNCYDSKDQIIKPSKSKPKKSNGCGRSDNKAKRNNNISKRNNQFATLDSDNVPKRKIHTDEDSDDVSSKEALVILNDSEDSDFV